MTYYEPLYQQKYLLKHLQKNVDEDTAKILLLQKDSGSSSGLEQLLRDLCFQVTAVDCIDKAVSMMDEIEPDFLIADDFGHDSAFETLVGESQAKNIDMMIIGDSIKKPYSESEVAVVMRKAMADRYPNPHLGRIGKYRVIYIDDKETILRVADIYLSAVKCLDFIAVLDVEDGLQRAIEMQPDMIITDIYKTRQKYSGLELLRISKAHPKLCYIPIVVMSSADIKDICPHFGAVERIVKPFNPIKLKETLMRLLEESRESCP